MSLAGDRGTDAGAGGRLRAVGRRVGSAQLPAEPFRLGALAGVLALTGAYVSVLYGVVAVVGGRGALLALVAVSLLSATVFARAIAPRTATALAAAVAAVGFAHYLASAGTGVGAAVATADELLADSVALAMGLPVLRMIDAGTWALGFAPAPAFLSWYLAVRRRYALSVLPAGGALFFLVLTGDAGIPITLAGVGGAVGAVGLGELERREGTVGQLDALTVLFSVALVLSMTVTLVPAGAASPTFLVEGDEGSLESTLDTAPERSGITGSVDLSPEVRFTVTSEERSYWRTGVYDRFTGDEWIRTGDDRPYEGGIEPPPGEYDRVAQTVRMAGGAGVMPAAAQPIAVEGEATENTLVTSHGGITPEEPMIENDTYNVESAVVDPSGGALREAGTEYPEDVERRHLQTPESLSTEFEAYTAEVTADAENPYETAEAIERYLRTSKSYSLEVDRPSGNVAEEFLLEMDEGYCVYFATTMVQMLRAEDVPARYAVGYTSGQEVDDGEYVVRGLDAHAWVEVYFPGHGWVEFEPTPGDRDDVHAERLEEARDDGQEDVDVAGSEEVPIEEGSEPENETDEELTETEPPAEETPLENETGEAGEIDPEEEIAPGPNGAPTEGVEEGLADRLTAEAAILALAIVVGAVAGARHGGVVDRAGRARTLRWQRSTGEPARDVERAYRRLELLLETDVRGRARSESVRAYLSSPAVESVGDDRIDRLGALYERAIHGDGVEPAEAVEAIELVDELVAERTRIVGRLRR